MAIAFRAKTHTLDAAPGEPAGTASGDDVFLWALSAAAGTPVPPAGWTVLGTWAGTNGKFALWWIKRGGAAPSYTWTGNSGFTESSASSYSGRSSSTTPLVVVNAAHQINPQNPDCPAAASAAAGSMILAFGGSWTGSVTSVWAAPAGYTIRENGVSVGNDLMMAEKLSAGGIEDPGAFSNGSATLNDVAEATVTLPLDQTPAWNLIGTRGPGLSPGYSPASARFYTPTPPTTATVNPDVTVALTGSLATFSAGALGPATDVPLTNALATFSAGTLIPTPTLALTNALITSSAGTLAPSTAIALANALASFSAGTLTPVLSLALSNALASFSSGSLTPSTAVVLSNALANWSAGTITIQGDVTVALTGAQANWSAGTIGAPTLVVARSEGGFRHKTLLERELERKKLFRKKKIKYALPPEEREIIEEAVQIAVQAEEAPVQSAKIRYIETLARGLQQTELLNAATLNQLWEMDVEARKREVALAEEEEAIAILSAWWING